MTALPLLLCALALVVVGILVFRLHPFFVLIGTALVVTAMAPIPPGLPAGATVGSRVAGGFGRAALDVGIPVTMATILGRCLLVSRGAERIVIALQNALGPGRTPLAFTIAGLVLGITMLPQAVLSLLLPLAKAAWRTTGRHYLLLVLSIVAGATMTPALVPPAPRQPYETWIVATCPEPYFHTASPARVAAVAELTRDIVGRLERLAPGYHYNWWLHQAPFPRSLNDDRVATSWHWHFEIVPRLSEFAGFEIGTGCHITTRSAEESAEMLRDAGG